MSYDNYRPISDPSQNPPHAKINLVDDEHIVFFEGNQTIWLLDHNKPKSQPCFDIFVITDQNAQFFDDNGKDITSSVYAQGLIDAIAEYQLEKEVLTVNMARNHPNAHPETVANLKAAADYALQYYHFTSDSNMWYNLL